MEDPLFCDSGKYPGHVFPWQGHNFICTYVSMPKIYRDCNYLDKGVTLIDRMIYYRVNVRLARGELDILVLPHVSEPLYYLSHRDVAAYVWRRYWKRDPIEVVTDGMITQAIMRFVHLVYSSSQFPKY